MFDVKSGSLVWQTLAVCCLSLGTPLPNDQFYCMMNMGTSFSSLLGLMGDELTLSFGSYSS